MRKLDFIIQTFLLLAAMLFLMYALIADRGFFIMIWLVQFLVGCWQIMSAFLTSINSRHGNPRRSSGIRIYWIAVFIYFAVLAILCATKIEILMAVWFFSAWLIAVYYYIFTFKLAFGKFNDRKSYLDIAN